jgi:hypothetical protein
MLPKAMLTFLLVGTQTSAKFDQSLRAVQDRLEVTSSAANLLAQVKKLDSTYVDEDPIASPLPNKVIGADSWVLPIWHDGRYRQVFAERKGHHYHLQFFPQNYRYLLRVSRVIAEGRSVLLIGEQFSGFLGNAPIPRIALYRRSISGLKQMQDQKTEFEGLITNVRKSKGRWAILAEGRDYPNMFGASHNMALVAMERVFIFQDGRLRRTKSYRIPSPMGSLDDLLAAAYKAKWSTVRSLCTSADISAKFRKEIISMPHHGWGRSDEENAFTNELTNQTYKFMLVKGKWKLDRISFMKPSSSN